MSRKPRASSVCGWCAAGQHRQCKGTTRRFVIESKGKRKIATVVWLDEYNECSCPKRHSKPEYKKPVEDLEQL